MEADALAEQLNGTDKLLLSAIKDSPGFISELSAKLNVDKTALLNSTRKLLTYNLVTVINELNLKYTLSESGKIYLKNGLPEYFLYEFLNKTSGATYEHLREIGLEKDELSAAIGNLKKSGILQMDNNLLMVDKNKSKTLEYKNMLLKAVSEEKPIIETDEVKDLLKRGIILRSETINEKVEIAPLGINVIKSTKFKKDLIDRLTPEIIKNWRGLEFREYNLETEPPIPLSGRKNIAKEFMSKMKDVLVAMGFSEMYSNYAESSFWNFDVLMFKQDHPDRDIQDTVYINTTKAKLPTKLVKKVKNVYERGFSAAKNNCSIGYQRVFDENKSKIIIMRGHTTATTFRYINDYISKNKDAPAKYFSISKVFRNETIDSTHLPEFYQVEGIVYGDNLNISHLIWYIQEFYARIGIKKIRLKPTYNPYTEPSLEIQAFSPKLNRWLEVGNSGVFRPETLIPFGIKKNIVAWGFGFDRMLLLRLGMSDVRALYGAFADLDSLRTIETRKLFGDLK
jgi:phenylalanyl-tRNA synthetase alpha chain